MNAEEYLSRSRLFQHLKSGGHGQLIERYTVRLIEDGLRRQSTWRCLNVVGGLLSWIASSRFEVTSLDEHMAERYLRHRARKQFIHRGDRAALKRFLSVLRDAGMIAPPVQPPITPNEQIFKAFGEYLQSERGLTRRTIVTHLPAIRRFLSEVCPNGAGDLGKISQQDVIHYIERHARDQSPKSGKAMCWSLRSFLRYLHVKGLNPPGWPAACHRSDSGSSQACRPICLLGRFRTFLRVATGQPAWGGGTTPSDDAGQARSTGQRGHDPDPG